MIFFLFFGIFWKQWIDEAIVKYKEGDIKKNGFCLRILIYEAKNAGAVCTKVQIFKADSVIPDNAQKMKSLKGLRMVYLLDSYFNWSDLL